MSGPPLRRSDSLAYRQGVADDPREELAPQMDHYIGIDVGTGSARACIMNSQGDIVGLASNNIGLWQPQTGYYVSNGPFAILLFTVSCSSRLRSEASRC